MRRLAPVLVALFVVFSAQAVFAGTSTLTLRRVSLTNVPDAAGIWQFSGGTVHAGPVQVGYYATSQRTVNGGTNTLNTSMFTCTLFFTAGNSNPPRNVTLQGAWSFQPGGGSGGVSAASVPYQFLQHDGVFKISVVNATTYTLQINWTGAQTLP